MADFKELHLTFDEIWRRMDLRIFVLVHMKDTMEPKIIDAASGTIFNVPEGYLDYDTQRYFRKY